MDKTTLQFPISCSYRQFVYKQYRWQGDRLYPADYGDMDVRDSFDAFDNPYLVPNLEYLIESTPEDKRKAAVKDRVSRYGFLTVYCFYYGVSESLEEFWNEAQRFVKLRQLYMHLQNGQLNILRGVVAFKPCPADEPTWKCYSTPKPPFTDMLAESYILSEHRTSIEDIEKNPLQYYQKAVLRFISYAIEERLEFVIRSAKQPAVADKSLTIAPQLQVKNLLQALYLQLYIQMGDGKKICPACRRAFGDRKADAVYCSNKCKQREKMRRYRARKRKKEKQKGGRN